MFMRDRTHDSVKENDASSNPGQEERSGLMQFGGGKKPLPENVTEYIQKVRDELKRYEENKKFYEKKRKKEIVLQLIDLLEEYEYPNEWLRLIIAQELGDYISTSYIEKILAEKRPDEEKKLKKQSTSQIAEIPQNDDKIPIEVSSTVESIVINNNGDHDYNDPYLGEAGDISSDVSTEIKTDIERQIEQGTGDIAKAKVLQTQINELQIKCSQLKELANESLMWKEKYTQLQQEFTTYRNKIIRGTAQIEFGSEFLPVKIEYNFKTNQFSARIPEEIIEQILRTARQ
jgi:hypothetical protein